MATVHELSEPYANYMANPLAPGEGVCSVCATFIPEQYTFCVGCSRVGRYADAVVPISYSAQGSQLHYELRWYKDSPEASTRTKFQRGLSAVMWRFLDLHEGCLAAAAGVDAFDVVATVPSSSKNRSRPHPLPMMVGEWIAPTSSRYRTLLHRSDVPADEHSFTLEKFEVIENIAGENVLLVDDTWTTGANVQSAAHVLKESGAGGVGVLVIGRHVRPEFDFEDQPNRDRLKALLPFEWDICFAHGV